MLQLLLSAMLMRGVVEGRDGILALIGMARMGSRVTPRKGIVIGKSRTWLEGHLCGAKGGGRAKYGSGWVILEKMHLVDIQWMVGAAEERKGGKKL